jgi:phosphate transport system permease protein
VTAQQQAALSRRIKRAQRIDRIATAVIWAGAAVIVALLGALILYIVIHGAQALSWHFITTGEAQPLPGKYVTPAGSGISAQLFNSIYFLVLTMLIAIPLGMGGGIYMAEYMPPGRIANVLRTCTEMLASLPSIVVGLFGLLIFVNKTHWGYTLLGGALAVTVLNLPVMVRVTEDSLHALANDLREGSLALGAGRWTTVRKVLLPAAVPSLVTGFILAAGRIFGEAAALLFTAGSSTPELNFANWNPLHSNSPWSPMRPAETLAVHIWKLNSESVLPDARKIADGSAAVLIIAVLLFNIGARLLGRWVYKRLSAT